MTRGTQWPLKLVVTLSLALAVAHGASSRQPCSSRAVPSSTRGLITQAMQSKVPDYDPKELPVVVLLGDTGAGKSQFAGLLSGQNSLFPVSAKCESLTDITSVKDIRWLGDGMQLAIADTPGLHDSRGHDRAHIENITTCIQDADAKYGGVSRFLILVNCERGMKFDERLQEGLKAIKKTFTGTSENGFCPRVQDFLNHVSFVFTHWSYASQFNKENNDAPPMRKENNDAPPHPLERIFESNVEETRRDFGIDPLPRAEPPQPAQARQHHEAPGDLEDQKRIKDEKKRQFSESILQLFSEDAPRDAPRLQVDIPCYFIDSIRAGWRMQNDEGRQYAHELERLRQDVISQPKKYPCEDVTAMMMLKDQYQQELTKEVSAKLVAEAKKLLAQTKAREFNQRARASEKRAAADQTKSEKANQEAEQSLEKAEQLKAAAIELKRLCDILDQDYETRWVAAVEEMGRRNRDLAMALEGDGADRLSGGLYAIALGQVYRTRDGKTAERDGCDSRPHGALEKLKQRYDEHGLQDKDGTYDKIGHHYDVSTGALTPRSVPFIDPKEIADIDNYVNGSEIAHRMGSGLTTLICPPIGIFWMITSEIANKNMRKDLKQEWTKSVRQRKREYKCERTLDAYQMTPRAQFEENIESNPGVGY